MGDFTGTPVDFARDRVLDCAPLSLFFNGGRLVSTRCFQSFGPGGHRHRGWRRHWPWHRRTVFRSGRRGGRQRPEAGNRRTGRQRHRRGGWSRGGGGLRCDESAGAPGARRRRHRGVRQGHHPGQQRRRWRPQAVRHADGDLCLGLRAQRVLDVQPDPAVRAAHAGGRRRRGAEHQFHGRREQEPAHGLVRVVQGGRQSPDPQHRLRPGADGRSRQRHRARRHQDRRAGQRAHARNREGHAQAHAAGPAGRSA